MEEEKITVKGNLKGEQGLSTLARLMGELGFSKISYDKDKLVVEKIKGHDLSGKPFLEYRMRFTGKLIEFTYNVPPKKSSRAILLELLPTFLSVLQVAEDYYEIAPSAMYGHISGVLKETVKVMGKDVVELSTTLSDIEVKHNDLTMKYDDLLRSSEANAKILLETERRRDELAKRVETLTKISDDTLRESLYDWIRMHGGSINMREFARTNSVSVPRIEEGLNSLISEGFIKRRLD
ncbi:MAG: hypothetical protein ABII71_02870 [Candidatus Micrarchaeota archaeon]